MADARVTHGPDPETVVKVRKVKNRWRVTLNCGHSLLYGGNGPVKAPAIGSTLRCPERPIGVVGDAMNRLAPICKLCGIERAAVPDREKDLVWRRSICRKCHAKRLIADLNHILKITAQCEEKA